MCIKSLLNSCLTQVATYLLVTPAQSISKSFSVRLNNSLKSSIAFSKPVRVDALILPVIIIRFIPYFSDTKTAPSSLAKSTKVNSLNGVDSCFKVFGTYVVVTISVLSNVTDTVGILLTSECL